MVHVSCLATAGATEANCVPGCLRTCPSTSTTPLDNASLYGISFPPKYSVGATGLQSHGARRLPLEGRFTWREEDGPKLPRGLVWRLSARAGRGHAWRATVRHSAGVEDTLAADEGCRGRGASRPRSTPPEPLVVVLAKVPWAAAQD